MIQSGLSETSFHVDNGLLQAEGSTPIINTLGGPVQQEFQKAENNKTRSKCET